MTTLILVGLVILVGILSLLTAFAWRRVVPTNMVHIVQSGNKTTSYGAGRNSYYRVPAFIPIFGVNVIELPVNNFQITLDGYDAYDKDRVPFLIDVVGFFRIADTNTAAGRVKTFKGEDGLEQQLTVVMKGAARAVLAKYDIHDVMTKRAEFGVAFTAEVDEGLKAWGVVSVKSMELMDIRDAKDSTVIHSIMSQKSSEISSTSRQTVAKNNQAAQTAEIAAAQAVALAGQDQELAVGQRKAEVAQQVGIAEQRSAQAVQVARKETQTAEMEVLSVKTQRTAEIDKAATITDAEGDLAAAQLKATGIQATGAANAEAARLLEMSKVSPQLELAAGTTGNKDYQDYLVRQAEVAAKRDVGIAQAGALKEADIKIIANSGGIGDGLSSVGGMLTSTTGQGIGAVLEGIKNTPEGAALLARLTGGTPNGKATEGATAR